MSALLELDNLQTYFHTREGIVKAVDGVSFKINNRETVALVGESGCGKSVTALSIMRLFTTRTVQIQGSILLEGNNLLDLTESEMRRIRGRRISMIFQEPMTSLNPLHRNGNQVAESLVTHLGLDWDEARSHALEIFQSVGIPDAEKRLYSYPHQLSGGLRQRVMIAMALACRPSLLIADEPTTALDVTIQAQIIAQMKKLKDEFQTATIFITHDLGVVAEIADRVIVMYAGHVVETASVVNLFYKPKHPYTQGLLKSIPQLTVQRKEKLPIIKGVVPSPARKPPGCPFAPRCPEAIDRCTRDLPGIIYLPEGHSVRCWLYTGCEEVQA